MQTSPLRRFPHSSAKVRKLSETSKEMLDFLFGGAIFIV